MITDQCSLKTHISHPKTFSYKVNDSRKKNSKVSDVQVFLLIK